MSGIVETDVPVIGRLSIHEPSKDKCVLLGFCHLLYHCAINDKECLRLHFDDDQSKLQRRVVSLGRQIKHMICDSWDRGPVPLWVCLMVHEKRYVPGGPKYKFCFNIVSNRLYCLWTEIPSEISEFSQIGQNPEMFYSYPSLMVATIQCGVE